MSILCYVVKISRPEYCSVPFSSKAWVIKLKFNFLTCKNDSLLWRELWGLKLGLPNDQVGNLNLFWRFLSMVVLFIVSDSDNDHSWHNFGDYIMGIFVIIFFFLLIIKIMPHYISYIEWLIIGLWIALFPKNTHWQSSLKIQIIGQLTMKFRKYY